MTENRVRTWPKIYHTDVPYFFLFDRNSRYRRILTWCQKNGAVGLDRSPSLTSSHWLGHFPSLVSLLYKKKTSGADIRRTPGIKLRFVSFNRFVGFNFGQIQLLRFVVIMVRSNSIGHLESVKWLFLYLSSKYYFSIFFSLHLSLWAAAWVTFNEGVFNWSCFLLQLDLWNVSCLSRPPSTSLFPLISLSFFNSHPSNRVLFSPYELQIEFIFSNTCPRVFVVVHGPALVFRFQFVR